MAGLFDSITSLFGTSAQDKAAKDQINASNQAYNQYSALTNQAINQLQQHGTQAGQYLQQYFPQAASALQTNYTAGLAPTLQNVGTAQQGTNQLLAALGIGPQGAAGSAGIQSLLAGTPGYQFALDQGTQNLLRNKAATGQLASGATNTDLMKYGTGLADQTYQSYVQNLLPFLQYGTNAASGALSGYGELGKGLGNIYTGLGTNLASNEQNLGTGVSGLLSNQGNAAYGTQMNIGNAQANADLAPLQAGKNVLGLLGGIAGLATGNPALASAGGKALFGGFGGQQSA